jgi:hypothetical protein
VTAPIKMVEQAARLEAARGIATAIAAGAPASGPQKTAASAISPGLGATPEKAAPVTAVPVKDATSRAVLGADVAYARPAAVFVPAPSPSGSAPPPPPGSARVPAGVNTGQTGSARSPASLAADPKAPRPGGANPRVGANQDDPEPSADQRGKIPLPATADPRAGATPAGATFSLDQRGQALLPTALGPRAGAGETGRTSARAQGRAAGGEARVDAPALTARADSPPAETRASLEAMRPLLPTIAVDQRFENFLWADDARAATSAANALDPLFGDAGASAIRLTILNANMIPGWPRPFALEGSAAAPPPLFDEQEAMEYLANCGAMDELEPLFEERGAAARRKIARALATLLGALALIGDALRAEVDFILDEDAGMMASRRLHLRLK